MSLHDEINKIDEELKKATNEGEKSDAKEPEKQEKEPAEKASESKKEKAADKGADDGESDDKHGAGDRGESADADGESKDAPRDEKPDSAAFAKLRMEAKAAERRAAAAEAKLKEAPTQPQRFAPESEKVAAAVDKEPDPNLDPEAHLRWTLSKTQSELREIAKWKQEKETKERQENLKTAAIKEYSEYEDNFAPTVKDYKEVTQHGLSQITNSIRTLNPHLQGDSLNEAVRFQVLRLAAEAQKKGHDPAEYFYATAKSWGYQPPQAEVKKEEPIKPNLSKVVEHKKKTAGSLSHGGKGGNAPLSKESFKAMSFAEVARLSPKELKELESMEATG